MARLKYDFSTWGRWPAQWDAQQVAPVHPSCGIMSATGRCGPDSPPLLPSTQINVCLTTCKVNKQRLAQVKSRDALCFSVECKSPSLLWNSEPSLCLFCSHYSHLGWQSTLFPLSPQQLKTHKCFQRLFDLGFNSYHCVYLWHRSKTDHSQASSCKRDGKLLSVSDFTVSFHREEGVRGGKRYISALRGCIWQVSTGGRCPNRAGGE